MISIDLKSQEPSGNKASEDPQLGMKSALWLFGLFGFCFVSLLFFFFKGKKVHSVSQRNKIRWKRTIQF